MGIESTDYMDFSVSDNVIRQDRISILDGTNIKEIEKSLTKFYFYN